MGIVDVVMRESEGVSFSLVCHRGGHVCIKCALGLNVFLVHPCRGGLLILVRNS